MYIFKCISNVYHYHKKYFLCQKYVEQNICNLRDNESFRNELEELPKLALFVFDSMSDMSGHPSVKRRRITSSPVLGANIGAVGIHDSTSTNDISVAFQLQSTAGFMGVNDDDDEIPDEEEAVITGNVVL